MINIRRATFTCLIIFSMAGCDWNEKPSETQIPIDEAHLNNVKLQPRSIVIPVRFLPDHARTSLQHTTQSGLVIIPIETNKEKVSCGTSGKTAEPRHLPEPKLLPFPSGYRIASIINIHFNVSSNTICGVFASLDRSLSRYMCADFNTYEYRILSPEYLHVIDAFTINQRHAFILAAHQEDRTYYIGQIDLRTGEMLLSYAFMPRYEGFIAQSLAVSDDLSMVGVLGAVPSDNNPLSPGLDKPFKLVVLDHENRRVLHQLDVTKAATDLIFWPGTREKLAFINNNKNAYLYDHTHRELAALNSSATKSKSSDLLRHVHFLVDEASEHVFVVEQGKSGTYLQRIHEDGSSGGEQAYEFMGRYSFSVGEGRALFRQYAVEPEYLLNRDTTSLHETFYLVHLRNAEVEDSVSVKLPHYAFDNSVFFYLP